MTLQDPRHFMGWDAHALPSATTLLADAYRAADVLDMGGAAVVLPGARAGRRLKELLVEEASRRSVRLVPPRVLTIGALPELLYAPDAPTADAETTRRVWLQQLRLLSPAERSVLFPRSPEAHDLRGWFALADVLAINTMRS